MYSTISARPRAGHPRRPELHQSSVAPAAAASSTITHISTAATARQACSTSGRHLGVLLTCWRSLTEPCVTPRNLTGNNNWACLPTRTSTVPRTSTVLDFSMAVVAVPFILYLVRFCSSKSCNKYSYGIGARFDGSVTDQAG